MKRIFLEIVRAMGYEFVKHNQIPAGSPAKPPYQIPAGSPDKPPYNTFFSVLEDMISRGFKCNSILDIGANNGSWSKMANAVFPSAKYYLIEPQIEMEPDLISFCNEHKGSKYFLNAAGSKNENRVLTVWDDKAGSSFVPQANEVFEYASEKREIGVITIDSLVKLNKIEIPDLVKLDVQGFEIEALKGCSGLFGKTEIFIIEVSLFKFEGMPLFSEVIEFMDKNGYAIYDFAGFSRRPYDGALGQCDIVFAMKGGSLTQYQHWR